ncbi:MAG: pyridoxamine 5'-phosphate oxidase family protein [Actinomycetota bacterium]
MSHLTKHGVGLGYLSTIRADDGGPRVHPVCPFLGDGKLFVVVPRSSPKSGDLRVDPRYMLHAFPDEQDPEFSIRGKARLVTDPEEREVATRSVTFAAGVRDHDDVFVLDVERADSTAWVNWAKADTYAVRKKWVAS